MRPNHSMGGNIAKHTAMLQSQAGPYYYATRGFYLPAAQVDEIAMSVVADFLNSDMSSLAQNVVMALKRIVIHKKN